MSTKMAKCKILYTEVTAEGAKNEGYRSARDAFMKRSQAEFGMTLFGASSYWNSLSQGTVDKPKYYYKSAAVRKAELEAKIRAEIEAEQAK